MNDTGLTEWLKWITGGIIGGMVLFWQWMERKLDRQNDRIDKLRDDTRRERHELASQVQKTVDTIDQDIEKVKDRVSKVERNTGQK